ncbi:MAG: ABC transporter permease subunit [Ornithinimicrobium sp.]|uniref:ABC transporter permease subunit n=1 Tax=Ornithinimicrobium sp. TaxID=1977084 RepID=UPI003D9AF9ED
MRAYGGAVSAFVERAQGGDLGSLPVIIGLVVIWTVFQLMNPALLSSRNLVNLTLQSAGLGTIALGVILVLLLGEIDLSLGSVAGVAASVLAVGFVQQSWPLWLAVLAAIASGTAIGARSTSRSRPAW